MKYIDADRLKAEIERRMTENCELAEKAGGAFGQRAVEDYDILALIDSLQQDETQVDKMLCTQVWWEEQGWIMIPPDATIEGIDSLLRQVKKKLQQEQRETDGDDGKFVKILVRKEYAEQIQRLGDEILAGQSSFIGAMNQREQPKCIYGRSLEEREKYCKFCSARCNARVEQDQQPEVDIEKEIDEWLKAGPITDTRYDDYCDDDIKETARHFYELGRNARKL